MRIDAFEIAQHVQLQRAEPRVVRRIVTQFQQVVHDRLALALDELVLARQQLAGHGDVSGGEHAERQLEGLEYRLVEVVQIVTVLQRHGAAGHQLLLDDVVDQVDRDDIADVLEIGGEAEDLGTAFAFLFAEGFARQAGEVAFDTVVEPVHQLVHLAGLLRQLAVVLLQRDKRVAQHALDDLAHPQYLAFGIHQRDQRGFVGAAVHFPGFDLVTGGFFIRDQRRRQADHGADQRKAEYRQRDVEQHVKIRDPARVVDGQRRELADDRVDQGQDDRDAEKLEQEVAQRRLPGPGGSAQGRDERRDRAADVGAEHQRKRDLESERAGAGQRDDQ